MIAGCQQETSLHLSCQSHAWQAWLIHIPFISQGKQVAQLDLPHLPDLSTKPYFKDPPHIPILPDLPGLTKRYCLALPNNHDTQVTPYLTYSTEAN